MQRLARVSRHSQRLSSRSRRPELQRLARASRNSQRLPGAHARGALRAVVGATASNCREAQRHTAGATLGHGKRKCRRLRLNYEGLIGARMCRERRKHGRLQMSHLFLSLVKCHQHLVPDCGRLPHLCRRRHCCLLVEIINYNAIFCDPNDFGMMGLRTVLALGPVRRATM